MGVPVQKKCRKRHELEQYVVGGQHGVTKIGSLVGKPGEPREQGQRADHDIAVYLHQGQELHFVENKLAEVPETTPNMAKLHLFDEQIGGKEKRRPLGQYGTQRDTTHAEIIAYNKEDIQQDVEPVEEQLHHQEVLRPPRADERAQQRKGYQGSGRAPNANVEI